MSRPRLRPVLTVLLAERDDGQTELRAPAVGLWRSSPAVRSYIGSGAPVGQLEVLGVLHDLVAPKTANGFVVEVNADDAREPVGYGDRLAVLDPSQAPADQVGQAAAKAGDSEAALVFRSPSSGRFYARPSPHQPAFVKVGDTITTGTTVCLLEVMKTFNRINYGGDGLPETAKVIAIRPADGDDLAENAVILELE